MDTMRQRDLTVETHLSANDLLNFIIQHDILDEADGLKKLSEMKKREELLKKHKYKIWHSEKNGWYTYLPKDGGGRRLVQKNTREKIEDAIVQHYADLEENPTVCALFLEWIEKKREREEITEQTAERYRREFDRFFKPIRDRKIRDISEYDVEEFALNSIHDLALSAKAFGSLRTILYGVFRLAKRKGLISYSITQTMKDLDISRKSFTPPARDPSKEVMTEWELTALKKYLSREGADIVDLGLCLNMAMGLRIGELSALMKEDVNLKRGVVSVHRTEVSRCVKGTSGKRVYEVKDRPKTEAGIREVFIPDSHRDILIRIMEMSPDGEALFMRNGERVHTYVFRNRLYHACKKAGIDQKPTHAMRRTYASILIDNRVSDAIVTSQMGHTQIATTLGYYYRDRSTEDEKRRAINAVKGL